MRLKTTKKRGNKIEKRVIPRFVFGGLFWVEVYFNDASAAIRLRRFFRDRRNVCSSADATSDPFVANTCRRRCEPIDEPLRGSWLQSARDVVPPKTWNILRRTARTTMPASWNTRRPVSATKLGNLPFYSVALVTASHEWTPQKSSGLVLEI